MSDKKTAAQVYWQMKEAKGKVYRTPRGIIQTTRRWEQEDKDFLLFMENRAKQGFSPFIEKGSLTSTQQRIAERLVLRGYLIKSQPQKNKSARFKLKD